MAENSKRRIIAGLFLTLFVSYYANVTLFQHCHIINGVTIVHSHFHSESHHSTPSGGHSDSSVTLIDALNLAFYEEAGLTAFDLTIYPDCYDLPVYFPVRKIQSAAPPHRFLRAPPAMQYFAA